MADRSTLLCTLLVLSLVSAACEVAANFDPKKLETDRTIGPVPLPTLDGATALIPDADVGDAAIGPPPGDDASVLGPSDAAGLDSAIDLPLSDAETDVGESSDAAEPDSGNDAGSDADSSVADAAL